MTVAGRHGAAEGRMVATLLVVWLACQAALSGHGNIVFAAAIEPGGTRPATLWVLAFGVSRYRQSDLNLQFADRDARAVAAALQKQGGGPLYRDTRTLVLTDEQVSRETILDSMGKFLGQAGPDDVAVIFLAGHGIQDRSTGSYYFLPGTAGSDNYVTAGVRMSDFDEMLRVVRRNVRGVVLMFDTCHAGALKVAAPHLSALDDPAARLTASEGFFLLAASKPGEESEERPELGHGAFSYAVLEALSGRADADRDQYISVTELFGYVTREVAAITGGLQHPYYKVEGSDFRLAAVKSGVAVLTPRGSPLPRSPTQGFALATPVPNTVAVLDFRNVRADPTHDWVGVALRTAFNTELSKVRALNVYAPELIDRTMKLRGTDQLSAAQELGIDRLVTGSFSVVGEAIRIDAHITYTATGLQEGSDSVQGGLGDFFDLQRRLVISMLRRLHVSAPGEEGDAALNRSNTDVDAYRLLLESEGEVETAPAPNRQPQRARQRTPDRRSSFATSSTSGLAALMPAARGVWQSLGALLAAPAAAQEPTPPLDLSPEEAVVRLLQDYRLALQSEDLDRLAQLYVSFPDRRRDTMRQYFENANDLQVEISDVDVRVHDAAVVVSYTRRDHFIDRQSGKPVNLEVRLTRAVSRINGVWKIAGKP